MLSICFSKLLLFDFSAVFIDVHCESASRFLQKKIDKKIIATESFGFDICSEVIVAIIAFVNYVSILEMIANQRTLEARGEEIMVNNLLPNSVEEGRKNGITDIDVLEATDYYKTSRGQTPNGATSAMFSTLSTAIGWDAFNFAEVLLTQPLLVIVGSKPGGFGAYRDGFEIIRRAKSEKKELFIVEGTSHYDLYDKEGAVTKAMTKLIPFFKENL